MRKIMIPLAVMASVLYACSGGGNTESGTTTASTSTEGTAEKPAGKDYTNDPAFIKGLELVKNSDCATCHKIDEKTTGPAYRDIANKYNMDDTTINNLANKVIKGGQGNWGNIPMAAHSSIGLDDAKSMVKYVLMLRNK